MTKYLIGASRIKYEVLDELFKDIKINGDIINLYIDTDYVFYRLYRNNLLSDIFSVDEKIIITDIVIAFINTLGHYRRYFVTRHHHNCRIFTVFNTKIPTYQKHCNESYGIKYYEKYSKTNKDYAALTDIIKKAYQFIQGIIIYFDGIYCIENHKIDNLTTIEHLKRYDRSNIEHHVIFTRNHIACQLLSGTCNMLYPKREHSFLVTAETCYKGILQDRKTTAGNMTPSTIPYAISLGGYTERDIEAPYCNGLIAAVKKLKKLWEKDLLTDTTSLDAFLEIVRREYKIEPSMIGDIKNVYNSISLSNAAHALTSDQKSHIESWIYDLFDQEGLNKINELIVDLNPDADIIEFSNLNMEAKQSCEYEDYMEWSI